MRAIELDVGCWRLETGDWKLEAEGRGRRGTGCGGVENMRAIELDVDLARVVFHKCLLGR